MNGSTSRPKINTRTYEWTQAPPTNWGFDYLVAISEGREPGSPIMYTIGWRIVEVERGKVTLALTPEPFHLNPHRVHGGVLGTLLDSATACAVISTLAVGESSTTLEIKTNFLRPVTLETGDITCIGHVVHRGRTVVVSEATITDAGRRELARATATSLITGTDQPA